MKKRHVKALVASFVVAYCVSYGISSRREREAIPEELLSGGYTAFRFPGTMAVSNIPGQLPVNRLQEVDDCLRVLYFPLIKIDRWIFKNVHHREISIETARGEHGECLGYPVRYRLD